MVSRTGLDCTEIYTDDGNTRYTSRDHPVPASFVHDDIGVVFWVYLSTDSGERMDWYCATQLRVAKLNDMAWSS